METGQVKILEQSMWMASAEDTILQKLRWYRIGKIEKLEAKDLLKEIKKINPEDYY